MFTRPLGSLALAATLALTATLAHAKGWRDLEAEYTHARDLVVRVARGEKLPEKDKKSHDTQFKEAQLTLEQLPEKMFKENAKKATDLLLQDLMHETMEVARAARKGLTKVTGRDAKPLYKAFEREKSYFVKRLLAGVLAQIDDRGAVAALAKETKDRDTRFKAEIARALGDCGARAKGPGESALRKLQRDKSILVQHAAAAALRKLGQKVDKHPDPTFDPTTGLPDHFASDRVVFLLDAGRVALEAGFEDPFAEDEDAGKGGEKKEGEAEKKEGEAEKKEGEAEKKDEAEKKEPKKGKGKQGKGKKEPPPPVSAYQLMGRLVTDAISKRMGESTYRLMRFGDQTTSFGRDWNKGGAKVRGDLEAWFGRRVLEERDRHLLRAIQDALKTDPDTIYLFLCGLPTDRGGRDDTEPTIARLEELFWGSGVQLHVIRFVVPPPQEPRTEGARQALKDSLAAYAKAVGKLSTMGRGQLRTIELARRVEEVEEKKGDKVKLDVDLTKSLSTRDEKKVEKAFKQAMQDADSDAEALVESIGACPDARKTLPLALEALFGDVPNLSSAAARGLAKNGDPKVLFALAKSFKAEKKPDRQIRLLHVMGRVPGESVTEGLLNAVGTMGPDPTRVAWKYLSERPEAELVAVKPKLVRRSRELTGLARAYANVALARAAKQPLPPRDGLETVDGRFLPARFLEGGVAFVVDSHRDTKNVFWSPPEKKEEAKDEDEGKKKKPKKKPKKGAEEKKDEPQPLTVLDAIRQEVTKALESVARAEGSANLYRTGGKSFRGTAVPMTRNLDEAKLFLAGISPGPQRDLLKPLERALEDKLVERIVVLVGGLPIRSAGAEDPKDLLDPIRKLNASRAVRIDVVYVLPPVKQDDPTAVAGRKDELAALDRLYAQLAGQNEGKVYVRTQLATTKPADAGK